MAVFRIQVVPDGRCCAIVLSGDVGLEIASELSAAGVEAARTTDHERIVVDFGGVTFLDSTGIGALVEIRTAALEAGKDLRIRNVTPRVERLLRITGLTEAFPVAGPADC